MTGVQTCALPISDARKKFWLDRKRTAAIARHTNAFKVNEDVVIPLDRMGEYTLGIERINIELSLRNKLALVDALEEFFEHGDLPLGRSDDAGQIASAELLEGRVWAALHMHAGDGNVHTNIPVNSDDYDMLQAAHGAVKRIMALARSLDGVISGEQIGRAHV